MTSRSSWIRSTAPPATPTSLPLLDPVTLDGLKPDDLLPPDLDGWNLHVFTLNRSVTVRNETFPAEFLDVGRLIRGTWDPQDYEYESLATWNTEDNVITLRVPWSMLAIADPSSKTGLVPKMAHRQVSPLVETIALTVNTGSGAQPVGVINWEPATPPIHLPAQEGCSRLRTGLGGHHRIERALRPSRFTGTLLNSQRPTAQCSNMNQRPGQGSDTIKRHPPMPHAPALSTAWECRGV